MNTHTTSVAYHNPDKHHLLESGAAFIVVVIAIVAVVITLITTCLFESRKEST